jgi:hypothetical protein
MMGARKLSTEAVLRSRRSSKVSRSHAKCAYVALECRIVQASGVRVVVAITRRPSNCGGCSLSRCSSVLGQGPRRLLPAIQGPVSIERVLRAMGLPCDVPELAPARAPPGGSELQSLQLGW